MENGISVETVVSFLAPITAQSLEMLASLMDEKRIETLELCQSISPFTGAPYLA